MARLKLPHLMLVLALLLGLSLYFDAHYNKNMVDMQLSGVLSRDQAQTMLSRRFTETYVVNHTMNEYGQEVVMTMGDDPAYQKMTMSWGRAITKDDRRVVVMGDKLASQVFKTATPQNQTYDRYGQTYDVIGVIKNSDLLMVAHDDDLLALPWDKVKLSVKPMGDLGTKRYNDNLRDVELALKHQNIRVLDTTRLSDFSHFFFNSAGLLMAFVLYRWARRGLSSFAKGFVTMHETWQASFRYQSLFKAIYTLKKTLVIYWGKGLVSLVALLTSIYLLYKIPWNRTYFPMNMFSLESYRVIIEDIYQRWAYRLAYGLTGVQVYFLGLLGLLCLGLVVISVRVARIHAQET